MITSEIKNIVQNLWDRLWAGGLTNPISSIEQISYLLFLKRLEKFKTNLSKDYYWSNYTKRLKGQELLSHIRNTVFPYIKSHLAKQNEPFAKAMEDSSLNITAALIDEAVMYIDAIYVEIEKQETNDNQHFHDLQGDIYEYLLLHTNEAGKNGQFRTPRHIIHFMTEILDPDLDGRICDIACGSGGFLVGAYQYIITKYSVHKEKDENGFNKGIDGDKLTKNQLKKLKTNLLFGFDIDQTMLRIGLMNLMMHGITHPSIVLLDTLSADYEKHELSVFSKSKITRIKSVKSDSVVKVASERYRYIIANPPFTGKINSLSVSENLDRAYKPKFDAHKSRLKQIVQSELLFLERIVFMLEKGGRSAVVVPEGVLFNSDKAYKEVRRILMTDCNLLGVLSLPAGVFSPYTNIKTSILVFEKNKLRNKEAQKVDVWFYEIKSDGYSLDANRRKLKENPLPLAVDDWRSRIAKKQTNRKLDHFFIPFSEIEKNGYELNFKLYQEFVYEPANYRDTTDILLQLQQLENDIFESLKDLNKRNT